LAVPASIPSVSRGHPTPPRAFTRHFAPIIEASGVRVKLLDGLRAGIPVVTTSDGALGLPLEDGKEALISSDPEGFAQRVERLVKDDALQERLPEAATRTLSHTTLFRSRNA
jgi:glycosyltransferase involved in cell wall biosynthesis